MTTMTVDYLSPSKIYFVNECKLRYVLTLSDKGQNSSKLFNKNTFLGILMHSVLEQYLKRQCSSEDYDSLWNELLNKMIRKYGIDKQDIDAIKYHLPYYTVKKNKLFHLLKTYNYDIPEFNLYLEKKITGGIVRGTADMIFDNPEEKKVKIIDFKTGPIATYENAEKKGMKAGYLFQLITYGYVYWLNGYAPENICCALQGISEGEYEEIVFSREHYQRHENLLRGLKKEINIIINAGKRDSLASPSPEACMYCKHSSSCNSLHASMNDELNYPSLSLIHQINSEFDDVESKINIITNGGKVTVYKIPLITYNLVKQIVRNGKSVFVSGLYEEEQVNIKYWTRYTQFTEL
jgi:hypothetical protein